MLIQFETCRIAHGDYLIGYLQAQIGYLQAQLVLAGTADIYPSAYAITVRLYVSASFGNYSAALQCTESTWWLFDLDEGVSASLKPRNFPKSLPHLQNEVCVDVGKIAEDSAAIWHMIPVSQQVRPVCTFGHMIHAYTAHLFNRSSLSKDAILGLHLLDCSEARCR